MSRPVTLFTGQAARNFINAKRASLGGKKGALGVVNAFTNSSVWHATDAQFDKK